MVIARETFGSELGGVVMASIPVYFHAVQLAHAPRTEWAHGTQLAHPESPERPRQILETLQQAPEDYTFVEPTEVPHALLREQHSPHVLAVLQSAAQTLDADAEVHPSVFPRGGRPDPTNMLHAGAWIYDTGTPLLAQTWTAATWSAACAWQAAVDLAAGRHRLAYALSRPPGHHASQHLMGGYCYLNNAALAARVLSAHGRVAILDIDYHHGDGTQSLFYDEPGVYTVSLHGDPSNSFPYWHGHPDETGNDRGTGFNLNLPYERGTDGEAFRTLLERRALAEIRRFDPAFLVIAAGFDAYHLDPIGDATLRTDDYAIVGELIGRLGLPTVAVQEGGYHVRDLGKNAHALLEGIRRASQ